ncbi:hypothetical protein BASA81_013255 [Batrachochytrium salamandrivorans]|nr:hypothetical protein BASA81_013255 [Batrachochytrium salamandrivorans]
MNVLCGESEHQETRGGKPATLLLKQELLEFHRVPSGAEMFCNPRRATSTSSPTPCRQTGSRARCCGTRRAPEKKKRLARKRELLALPKDLKRVRPEPSAKRAELYVAPTGSSKRVVGVDPGKSDLISSGTGPVLGWGDWGRGSQMKFLEPTKGVGMRKLFLESGLRGGAGGRVPHLVHLLRVRGGARARSSGA